jgi:RNA polymerase sigma factor (sigma-70 family)
MPSLPLATVVRHVRSLGAAPHSAEQTDAELLHAFAARSDSAAFAALVKRHGPLVLAVCRRVLHQLQDAEDAFQATFIVLSRKAASVCQQASLSGWLHGVSHRIALNARRAAARRRRHEGQAKTMHATTPAWEAAWREVQLLLDEEVQRLPEKYREPFVLCCLESLSCAEAGRRLGVKEGTVWSRLAEARRRLQLRLARRGVALTAVLGTAALVASPAAAVADPLAMATVRAAVSAAGDTLAADVVSEPVAALVRGMTRAVLRAKTRLAVALCVALGALAGVAGLSAYRASPEQPLPAAKAPDGARGEGQQARADHHGDPLPPGAIARMGTVRFRRDYQAAYDFAFTPDGKTLVGARSDKTLQVWDVATGRPLRELRHEQRFTTLALSADGMVLATAGPTGITVWDMVNQKPMRKIATRRIAHIAVSPDGKTIAAVEGARVVCLWDTATGAEKHRLINHTQKVHSLRFTPDGKTLFSAERAVIRASDVATGREVRTIHADGTTCIALSADGSLLACGGTENVGNTAQGMVSLYDAATGRKLRDLRGRKHFIEALAISPDGKTLAAVELETVSFWEVATCKELRRIEQTGWRANRLAFSPDGKTLASTAYGNETVIRLWDVATGKARQPTGPDGVVHAVAFSPDGRLVVTGSWLGHDQPLRLWDAATGKPLWASRDKVGFVNKVAFTPDGKGILVSGTDGALRLRDAPTGKEVRSYLISDARNGSPVTAMALSPDGKRVTSVSEGAAGLSGRAAGLRTVIVWDVGTGKRLLQREGQHPSFGNVLPFSPDGTVVAEVKDRLLRLYEVTTGRLLLTLDPSGSQSIDQMEESVAFSPDGRTVAAIGSTFVRRDGAIVSVESRAIHLWELATGKPALRIAAGKDRLTALAFSPDGRTLAAAGKGVVQLHDVATGKQVLTYRGQEAEVCLAALAFSPDGTRLAAGYADATALVWDLTPGLLRAAELRKARGRLDPESLWSDLAGADAGKAHAAVWVLIAAPEDALPFLTARLKPVERVDPDRLRRLLADLDSREFAVRQNASRELKQIGDRAEPELRAALEGKPSLEFRRRIQEILDRPQLPPAPESIRRLRALHVLEQVGTPEALRLLQAHARGAPGARETREAQAALERLARRAPPTPP